MFMLRVILYHIIKHKLSFTQIAFSLILFFFQFKPDKRTVRHDIDKELADIFTAFYNHGHNILEFYNVLIQTRLTTSKTKRDI